MWTQAFSATFKAALFLILATWALYLPLARSTGAVSYAFLEQGPKLYGFIASSLVKDSLLPSLLVGAALVGLFPCWRILRVALPMVAALTLAAWACWMWWWYGPAGRNAGFSITADRWPLVAAGPVGIVAATTFVFLLARARRPGAPVS